MTLGAYSAQMMGQTQSSAEFVPVTDAMLQAPAPEDWLMWRRTLDSWGYSPLDQVTRENVNELRMVWTRALARGRQEGTPLGLNVPRVSGWLPGSVTGRAGWTPDIGRAEKCAAGTRPARHTGGTPAQVSYPN